MKNLHFHEQQHYKHKRRLDYFEMSSDYNEHSLMRNVYEAI